jgi:hypothetical protein
MPGRMPEQVVINFSYLSVDAQIVYSQAERLTGRGVPDIIYSKSFKLSFGFLSTRYPRGSIATALGLPLRVNETS